MELIDKQYAIDALKICDNNEDGINCYKCPIRDKRWDGAWQDDETICYRKLMRDSAELLSVHPEQRWIPVSERLPEDIGEYLVTDEHTHLYIARYDFFNDHTVGYWKRYFRAWMPLPEPYKEETNE